MELVSSELGASKLSLSVDGVLELENQWAFWFDRYIGPGRSVEEYAEAMKELGEFRTVQDFWRYYNNLPSVDTLQPRTSYHVMKKGIQPLWEDPLNVRGGSFSVVVSKTETEKIWLYLLLCTVGEKIGSLLHSKDAVCGLSISIRKDCNVISIWNLDASLGTSAVKAMSTLVPKHPLTFSYKAHFAETDFKPQKKDMNVQGCVCKTFGPVFSSS